MILKFDKVCKNFESLSVLRDVSLNIGKKEFICIVGPSGCGKSTILNLISGILKPDSGKINNLSNKIGYVFQEDRLLPWKTVYENVKLVSKYKTKSEINVILKSVGLEGFENKFPFQLSGGMRQRCSIARAFVYEADLLLMDEPFKSLDYNLRISMTNQLMNIWKKVKNSVIFITHEIDEALLLGDRVFVLSNRPTCIVKELKIDIPQKERKLEDKILQEYRNSIIKLLL